MFHRQIYTQQKFCKMAITPPIAVLRKAKTPAPQGL
jgi:hypothetical protein